MRWPVIVAMFLLGACAGGYDSPEAETRIEFQSVLDMAAASQAIQDELRAQDFQLLPSRPFPENMTREWPAAMKWRDRNQSLLERRSGGSFAEGDLIVYVTPFPRPETFFDVPDQERFPVLQVSLLESRPGGFSPQGRRAYADLMNFLREQNYHVVVVSPPPDTDNNTYVRVVLSGWMSTAVWWLISWGVGLALFGGIANACLRRVGVSIAFRRMVLIFVGAVCATPVPVPAALSAILLPGLPWLLGSDEAMAGWTAVSLAVSIALSAIAAFWLIGRSNRAASPAT